MKVIVSLIDGIQLTADAGARDLHGIHCRLKPDFDGAAHGKPDFLLLDDAIIRVDQIQSIEKVEDAE